MDQSTGVFAAPGSGIYAVTGSPLTSGRIGFLKLYHPKVMMNQSPSLYDTSAALALIDPWLRAHLPNLDEAVTRR
jgi:hypothetical protein